MGCAPVVKKSRWQPRSARSVREEPETNTGPKRKANGETAWPAGELARDWRSPDPPWGGKPSELKGSVLKRRWGASGGWRRNDGKDVYMNQGDLPGTWSVFRPPLAGPKSRPGRSQSGHSSVEAG